jgi:hypothetical protein
MPTMEYGMPGGRVSYINFGTSWKTVDNYTCTDARCEVFTEMKMEAS